MTVHPRHAHLAQPLEGAISLRTISSEAEQPAADRRVILANPQTSMEEKVGDLLYWAIVFLVVGIIAALFGFGGVAGTAIEGARLLFWVAIVLFVIALVGGLLSRGGV